MGALISMETESKKEKSDYYTAVMYYWVSKNIH